MKSVINKVSVDSTTQPIFFGEDLSVQRYDKCKYEALMKSFKTQLDFFWRPEEVELSRDRNDYLKLSDHERFIFTANLKYQILLDSVQSRGIPLLAGLTTLPELEAAMSAWQFFETLHSYSYTYIIKNIYPDPSIVLDTILQEKAILDRADSVTANYDELINKTGDVKKSVYLTLISINILEGIRFYVSFACAYAFGESKMMEGNAKIIKLINRDENLHLQLVQNIIKYLKYENEGFDFIDSLEKEVLQMFEHAVEEEKKWAAYLFGHGGMLGLNVTSLEQYIEWVTNNRLRAIGYPTIYSDIPNPMKWISNWSGSKEVQVAPQETEVENYRIGAYESDLDKMGEFDI